MIEQILNSESGLSVRTKLNQTINIVNSAGNNNGLATLDSNGKVPAAQLPNFIMEYQGTWDASTNTPTLANGVGNADIAIGNVYKVSVAGSVDFGSGNIEFKVGDLVILNSSKVWENAPAGSENFESIKTALGYTPAKENGTILYHATPWFAPSQSITISADGLSATTSGSQFTAGTSQVGAKLIVNGIERIVTTPNPTTTVVNVTVAFPAAMRGQTYNSVQWGLYSKQFESTNGNSKELFYDINGVLRHYLDNNNNLTINSNYVVLNSGSNSFSTQSSSSSNWSANKGQLRTTPIDGSVENDGRTLYHTDVNAIRKGFAKEDGTILYHTTAWITAGTISTSGTTITGVGTAFTGNMVGAKIIAANGEQRIITGYTSGTVVTIDRAFVGSISGSAFGVYNKSIEITTTGLIYLYGKDSNSPVSITAGSSLSSRIASFSGQSASSAPINILAGTKKTTPASGDVENDGQNILYTNSGTTRKALSGTVYSSAALQQVVNTTTETSLFNNTAYYTTPTIRNISANSFKVGSTIRIKMSGIVTTGSPTTSATLRLKLGGVTIATVVEPLANNMTNYYFDKEITLVCRTTGATGTAIYQGRSFICSPTGTQPLFLPIQSTTAFTLNTTQNNTIDLTFQWDAASATNDLKVDTATIEVLC